MRSFVFYLLLVGSGFSDIATFASGCFWCTQADFDKVDGVLKTEVGYIGGKEPNPTYEAVSSGTTDYVEAVQLSFDPEKVSYEELLKVYWVNVDPTRDDGQFCDRGKQYRPVIFTHNDTQKELAEQSKEAVLNQTDIRPLKVEIIDATPFYPAEAYHQKYYEKNPYKYKFYRYTCGRDKRLKELWEGFSFKDETDRK